MYMYMYPASPAMLPQHHSDSGLFTCMYIHACPLVQCSSLAFNIMCAQKYYYVHVHVHVSMILYNIMCMNPLDPGLHPGG